MKYYVVIWVHYKMPGGLLGKFIPAHLRPILGEAAPRHKIFTKLKNACTHIRKVGRTANPKLFYYEGLRAWERDVDFETAVKIEGEKR